MRGIRGHVSWGLLVALLLALAGGEAAARQPRGIAWAPCGEEYPGLECATFAVPLDHRRPRGATTTIALARVPAEGKAHGAPSLFVNPGGPGGSGVQLVLQGFGEFLHANLGGRFHVVGFDPRGVGGSDPIHCFNSLDDLFAFVGAIPVFPYEKEQFRPFYDHLSSLAGHCLARDAEIAAHMSTADVARDLDLLREAVGDKRLTYLGFSYGSYLGTTYANLFPKKVRALAIDGVLNPVLWSSGRQIESDRVATQAEFDEFLRLCDEAGEECAFSARKGAARRWEQLARSVLREPIDLGDGFLYTYDFLIADATGAMYVPEIWGGPDGFGAFLGFLADAALGDRAAAALAREARGRLLDALREADYPNGLDSYFGNQCADTEYPDSFHAFRAGDAFARAGSRFGPYWWWFNAGCAAWPVAADRYTGPWTAHTSAPVLVVGNFFDGVTDHAGAEAVASMLPNSRLLSYAGWGHTAYGRSECAAELINAYLLDGSLPPAGTVCPANPNPFLGAAFRAAAPAAPLVGLPPPWLLRPGR